MRRLLRRRCYAPLVARLGDPSRLEAVEGVLRSTEAQQDRFARVVRLAGSLFDVPVVAVNLVDDRHQVSLAQMGLESSVRPVSHSICATAVDHDVPLLVPDAAADPRFADHPAVTGSDAVAFYAGMPLHYAGEVVGTLCLADEKPRELTDAQQRMLADLASWVEQDLLSDQEVQEGLEVQRRLLPSATPDIEGVSVAGHCQPARTVGGDFYDWQVVQGRLQVVLADVMGKGLAAAVVAAGVRALLRGTSPFHTLAASVTRAATDSQADLDEAGGFVTMFAVRLDPRTGHLEYVDAGHGLALVLRAGGSVRRLHAPGLPLGALPGDEWESHADHLDPGDLLLVVSDGVLDAFPDPDAALAAAARLAEVAPDPETAVQLIVDRVGESTRTDDITVIAVCRGDA